MDFGTATAAGAWLAVTTLALTASCLIAYTVGTIRNARTGWELFAGLVVISVAVPALLVFLATRLPPRLFDFLQ
jgi:hypothetical protein